MKNSHRDSKNLKTPKDQNKPATSNTCILYVNGMHCPSCELLIEQTLNEQKGVKNAKASLIDNRVTFEYTSSKPHVGALNNLIKALGYKFSEHQVKIHKSSKQKLLDFAKVLGFAGLFTLAFLLIERSGIAGFISVNKTSSLFAIFLFGLAAGVSTCSANVGGLLISLSKRWDHTAQPFILFNIGRLLFFAILGGILGAIGGVFNISITVTAVITLVVSSIMLILGLQMLGVRAANLLDLTFTKPLIQKLHLNEQTQNVHHYMAFLIGGLTFFIPCGFTIIAQGIALASGSFIYGFLVMLSFALGTLPMLGILSFTSIKFNKNPKFSWAFNKTVGFLVVMFALYTISSQLNLLGVPKVSDVLSSLSFKQTDASKSNEQLPPVIDGRQIINMTASSYGYTPTSFTIRANTPVSWNIENIGASGCTGSIVSKDLIKGQVVLQPGINVVEFTAPKPGFYSFSCWMGMFTGMINAL